MRRPTTYILTMVTAVALLVGGTAAAGRELIVPMTAKQISTANAAATSVATFQKLQDANVTLPQGGINDLHIQFDLPGLSGDGILIFKLRSTGNTTFQFCINDAGTLSFTHPATPTRSFHEIYPFSTLREQANSLTMAVSGDGTVTVSDIIILYRTTI